MEMMINDTASIFLKYQSNDSIDEHQLEKLFYDVGLIEKIHDHQDHRHKRELDEDHDEEDHHTKK